MKIWFLDHLQGRLPLGRVFWLHRMALRLLMYASVSAIGCSTRPWFWFLISLLLLDLGLFVWQLIGFSRSGDAYVRRLGNVAFIWGGYSAFALTAIFSLILLWGLILSALATLRRVSCSPKKWIGFIAQPTSFKSRKMAPGLRYKVRSLLAFPTISCRL